MTRAALRALWEVGLPAALAAVGMRALVPAAAAGGVRGWVATQGQHHGVLAAMVPFLMFSALCHYWSPYVLGGPASRGSRKPVARRDVVALATGVALTAGAAVALRRWVAEPYRVLGASMLPTLAPDDQVLGRKRVGPTGQRAPARGDVVAFRGEVVPRDPGGSPWPEILVKRVIGLPGDRVAMHDDAPVINGWPVPWCDAGEYTYMLPDGTGHAVHGRLRVEFLDDRAYLTVHAPGPPFDGTYDVRRGEVFVLGDNRGNSVDSRAYARGGAGVPIAGVEAEVRAFLSGTHRSGDVDWSRVLRGVDTLEARVRLEGLTIGGLDEGVARCFAGRPAVTRPPSPSGAPEASRHTFPDFERSILGIGDQTVPSDADTSPIQASFHGGPRDLRESSSGTLPWSVP